MNDTVQRQLGMGVIFERLAKPHFGMETDEAVIAENLPKVERIFGIPDTFQATTKAYQSGRPITPSSI